MKIVKIKFRGTLQTKSWLIKEVGRRHFTAMIKCSVPQFVINLGEPSWRCWEFSSMLAIQLWNICAWHRSSAPSSHSTHISQPPSLIMVPLSSDLPPTYLHWWTHMILFPLPGPAAQCCLHFWVCYWCSSSVCDSDIFSHWVLCTYLWNCKLSSFLTLVTSYYIASSLGSKVHTACWTVLGWRVPDSLRVCYSTQLLALQNTNSCVCDMT